MPKPSFGCAACRQRRVKCDERRNNCMKCARYGIQCPGYPDKFDVLHRSRVAGDTQPPSVAAHHQMQAHNKGDLDRVAWLPTEEDWAAKHDELRRLYVYERRKLQPIMCYMERERGFKATAQAYRKRFAKWGFRQSSRRVDAAVTFAGTRSCPRWTEGEHGAVPKVPSVPLNLGSGHDDSLMLSFLASVRGWGLACLESLQLTAELISPVGQRWPDQARETSLALKLVGDLLDRDDGAVAGRMVRKVFLLVEDILTLDAPLLTWSLLEMMYHMVDLGQEQLFRIFLAHLTALVSDRMPAVHPLRNMLRTIGGLVAGLEVAACLPSHLSGSASCSASPSKSLGQSGSLHPPLPSVLCRGMSHVLKQAWYLNAEMIFGQFNPRFFQLYCQLYCESSSISPPEAIVQVAKQWIEHIERQQLRNTIHNRKQTIDEVSIHQIARKSALRRLSWAAMSPSPPPAYNTLLTTDAAELREHESGIFTTQSFFNRDRQYALYLVPTFIKARYLQDYDVVVQQSEEVDGETETVSRSQASIMTCIMSAMLRLRGSQLRATMQAVERIRSIVVFGEYAYGEYHPEVLRGLLGMETACTAIGAHAQAREAKQIALHRIEHYIQDIPLDCV